MNNEERVERIEGQIEFIVNQQAHFASDIQRLGETVQQLASATTAGFEGLIDAQLRTQESLIELAQGHQKLVEAQARTEEQLARTDEKLAETDERLNSLINVVERHISEGHNRRPQEE